MSLWQLEVIMFLSAIAVSATAMAQERSEIAAELKWNLADLYPSVKVWQATRDKIASDIPKLAFMQGKLGDSAQSLYKGLSFASDLRQSLERLRVYAMQLYDEDTRISANLEMNQTARQLSVEYASAAAFVRPEILSLGVKKVRNFIKQEDNLKDYEFYLEEVLRYQPHTLSSAEEKIAAAAGNLAHTGSEVFSILTNADLPYPEITLSTGEKVRLDTSAYSKYRAVKNRGDREAVFKTFFNTYKAYRRTLGATLYAQIKANLFDKDIHKFKSALSIALFDDNIPTAVYTELIADVHQSLPTLHRYLKLRQRMLGLKELRYTDLYVPLVDDVALSYTPQQAIDLTVNAVAFLGNDYVATLKQGLTTGWVDFMPSTGKRSGAYSVTAYGVHPYELLNFNGQYEDVTTLAHESGHAMHSFLTNGHQPYINSNYSIFVAEVASTLNENLLLHHLLEKAKDDNTRLYLLGNYLENLRQTLFRQVFFAEFELAIYQRAEKGEALSGESLSKIYLDLVRQYYGHDKGVCKVDDLYGVEWAFVPHFYYNFYVYQYATSVVASLSIANAIRNEQARGQTQARDAYLNMLKAGGSNYPIELLKAAGVDMTTKAPFDAAMREMNKIIDEIEAIVARRKK
ncbi:MAG: oligoendopeptidase F [Deltaproteobacteria bacterium]|nr:oligoendopeptidase F [Deltaproteobacteria bacterium]